MRLHSGRYQDRIIWEQAVLKCLMRWTDSMPTVTVLDQRRLIILDVIRGKYKSQSIQSWQKALVYAAVLSNYQIQGDQQEVDRIIAKEIDGRGKWKKEPHNIDEALLAYYLLCYSKNREAIKPAMDFMYNLILSNRGSDGLICYRKSSENARFVDTLGLVCPFLCAYGVFYGEESAINLANLQIEEYEKYGMHPQFSLPIHAYDAVSKEPLGLYGWGRGMAWYLLALGECYNVLDNKRTLKEKLLKRMTLNAEVLFHYQKDNGGIGWMIQNMSTYDSSATAGYAYFYSILFRETRNIKYYEIVSKALECLMRSTQRNGAIDYSQGDTKGIGMYSASFSIMPFTQGLTYLAINNIRGAVNEREFEN